MTKHGSSYTQRTSRCPSRRSCCQLRIQLLEPVCQLVVASSQIAPAEASLAPHPAITADAPQRGATAVAERLAGVVVQAVVHRVGEEEVEVGLPAGVEMADAQPTAAVMEAAQLMAEQPHTAALPRTAVEHPMVEAHHMVGTTVTALRTEVSTLAAVHLVGAALALATRPPSRVYLLLLLVLTTLLLQAHMRRQRQAGMVPTLRLLPADRWTHLHLEITQRLRLETRAMASLRQLRRHQVLGTSQLQRRAVKTPAIIEHGEIV